MSDNRFEPIYKAHAIVEMVVFFEFAQGLGGTMERLLLLGSEMKGDFPSSNILQAVEVTFPPNQQPTNQAVRNDGVELHRFKPDGTFEWLIRITSRSISIHCLEYTRWEDVWFKINRYISTIFRKLAGAEVVISGVGLKYVDQFVFHGEIENYDLSQLFKKDTPVLNSRAFSSGANWHCYCGWFQDMTGLGKVLSQMNTTGIKQDGEHGVIVIDHTFTLHTHTEDTLLAPCLSPNSEGEEARSNIIEKMHAANKYLLSELLVDSMQQRISLCAEDTL
jgi:uncharacterized protein (TIGR04255 family)